MHLSIEHNNNMMAQIMKMSHIFMSLHEVLKVCFYQYLILFS